ncbi:hypothetical protein VNO77_14718 [Canavalia gladiata]|uniref:Uncharacterized protein n=1 Tax=Canavalia gladiata TaxID=3824 RepID=A0AAN9QNU8_CANGL
MGVQKAIPSIILVLMISRTMCGTLGTSIRFSEETFMALTQLSLGTIGLLESKLGVIMLMLPGIGRCKSQKLFLWFVLLNAQCDEMEACVMCPLNLPVKDSLQLGSNLDVLEGKKIER